MLCCEHYSYITAVQCERCYRTAIHPVQYLPGRGVHSILESLCYCQPPRPVRLPKPCSIANLHSPLGLYIAASQPLCKGENEQRQHQR